MTDEVVPASSTWPTGKDCEYRLHSADMIGMRVRGNQKIYPGDTEFSQITEHPITHVDLPGIDQDRFSINDKEGGVPLSDIKKIHR